MIPNLSVVWVVFFVILLSIILDRLLFRPVLRVVAERQGAVTSAQELAQSATGKANAAALEYDRALNEVRTEGYRHLDERRRGATERRAALLRQARSEAEAQIGAATERMQAQ